MALRAAIMNANGLRANQVVALTLILAAAWTFFVFVFDEPSPAVTTQLYEPSQVEQTETIRPPPPLVPLPGEPASRLDLDRILHQDGVVNFRTNDGVFQGIDNDVEVELRADGSARVIVYGAGVQDMRGTYHVFVGGRIEFQLGNVGWPDLVLRRDARSLMLAREQRDEFAFGEPYRAIKAAEAAKHRAHLFGTGRN
jgi:hypothetical protein